MDAINQQERHLLHCLKETKSIPSVFEGMRVGVVKSINKPDSYDSGLLKKISVENRVVKIKRTSYPLKNCVIKRQYFFNGLL